MESSGRGDGDVEADLQVGTGWQGVCLRESAGKKTRSKWCKPGRSSTTSFGSTSTFAPREMHPPRLEDLLQDWRDVVADTIVCNFLRDPPAAEDVLAKQVNGLAAKTGWMLLGVKDL